MPEANASHNQSLIIALKMWLSKQDGNAFVVGPNRICALFKQSFSPSGLISNKKRLEQARGPGLGEEPAEPLPRTTGDPVVVNPVRGSAKQVLCCPVAARESVNYFK